MFAFKIQAIRLVAMTALAIILLTTPVLASDHNATPSPGIGDDLGAFIREGSCDQPGKVIDDVGELDPDDEVWTVIGNHDQRPDVVFGEDEGIDQKIDDLLESGYIVTIHTSDDENASMIACGKIEGTTDTDGTLTIDLQEIDNSGFIGRVHFGPLQHQDESTEVTTGVWQTTAASPIASPASPVR